MSGRVGRWNRRSLMATGLVLALGCGAEVDAVPEGALARVADRVIESADVASVQAQLGQYGQTRFRGLEGQRALLEEIVTQTVLELEANAVGLGDDPRVHFALLEEHADLQRSAEAERRVPIAEVAADVEALRAYYEAHPREFEVPERRSAQLVMIGGWLRASEALAQVDAGEVEFEDLGEVLRTSMVERDDHRSPMFHRLLFDPELVAGDVLPLPVFVNDNVAVARVLDIAPATTKPFEDPAVREALVTAVRAPAARAAAHTHLEELRERYPAEPG